MIIKKADELRRVIRKILMAAGADERNAHRVAEALVSANLSGVDTHGLWHLPHYVAAIKEGHIVPTAWPEILTENPTSTLVGGNWTFGHVTAKYAMETAIEKAQKQNIAVVGAVQVHHTGRLGEYAEMAACKGMVGMIWNGGLAEEAPVAVPYGGRKRVLSTNPIAMGFPAGEETPMIMDYATTAVSGGKVFFARDNNQPLPPGCIVDKDSNPTTDPKAFFDGGAHLPFGEHKGYALMMAVEFLGRIVSGSDAFAVEDRGGLIMRHSGLLMIVFKADLFQPFEDYARRVDEMERRVRAVPPGPGFEEVLIPGDREKRTRAARQRDGIPIPDAYWQNLIDLAKSLGLKAI